MFFEAYRARLARAPRITKILWLEQFLEGFTPIMALYAIMFDRVGQLSLSHIGWLFSIWSIAYLAAELPSGVLADRWSRKYVIIMGGVLRTLGLGAWLLWPGFWGYAVGFALWGVMLACSSGAVTAYLHSELRAIGQEGRYARHFGLIMSGLSFGSLIGYGFAALLTLRSVNILIALSALSSAAYVLLMWFTPEHPYKKQTTYLQTLRTAAKEIIHAKTLFYLCFLLFSIYMIIGTLEELIPRVYANLGVSDTGVSLLGAIVLLASALSLTKMEHFVRLSLHKQVLVLMGGVVAFIIGVSWSNVAACGFVLFFNLLFHVFRPLFMHHVQHAVASDERATVGSMPGLGAGLLSAGAYVVIGKIAEHTSERFSLGLYAFVWLVILAVAMGAWRMLQPARSASKA